MTGEGGGAGAGLLEAVALSRLLLVGAEGGLRGERAAVLIWGTGGGLGPMPFNACCRRVGRAFRCSLWEA